MKRVIVIGSPGSGKSTFARRLRDRTSLPLFHLDLIWHKSDRTNISREEFDQRLSELLALDEWIIDGNYSRTLETRFRHCDTVFLFDLPAELCIEGVKSRIGKKRDDLPWVEETLDAEFEKWTLGFPKEQLGKIYSLIDRYADSVDVCIFKTREQADSFFN